MDTNSFTSGPIRPLSSQELGVERLTDYELLSDSGHNLVYRAQMGGKWVVLKAAKPDKGEQTRNQLLLEREFEIMHRLDSIYVVQTIAMVDDPQLGRSILMEYVHGRPLDRFVAENPSSAERRRVAEELMEALVFLHDRQVVHGDLKPSNILITDSGNHVRLIDFGFSDHEAFIAKNIGTSPSISSPEQLPTDVLKPERDIYALGKILALLFPHSSIHQSIISSIVRRYTSVRQVRTALHRYWLWRWLLPLILAITTIVAFVIVFLPNPTEMVQTPETQTDTVVVVMQPAQPEVDSVWLNLKVKTDKQYTSLYLTYADSLTNMPVKTMNEGSAMTNRYTAQMHQTRDKLAKSYPQYEEQLQKQYLATYGRDLPRLQIIYKDYPIMHVNLNGDTTFIPVKPLSE
ncbi:MAG: protein kinase [Paludibacteraceae bacterium]|nr:protein kinase [Paludibacteraceae bacterium]